MNKFEAVLLFSPNLTNPLITKEEESFTKNIEKKANAPIMIIIANKIFPGFIILLPLPSF